MVIDPGLTENVRVTVIATGFKSARDVARGADLRAREAQISQEKRDKIRSLITERLGTKPEAPAGGAPRFVEKEVKSRGIFGLRQIKQEATAQEDDQASTAVIFVGFAGQYMVGRRHAIALAVDFQVNDASRQIETRGHIDVELSYTFTF